MKETIRCKLQCNDCFPHWDHHHSYQDSIGLSLVQIWQSIVCKRSLVNQLSLESPHDRETMLTIITRWTPSPTIKPSEFEEYKRSMLVRIPSAQSFCHPCASVKKSPYLFGIQWSKVQASSNQNCPNNKHVAQQIQRDPKLSRLNIVTCIFLLT